MSIQKKHEELIESSYKELEILKSEVTQLEDIRKNIEILISGNNDLPPLFLELYQKLEALSVTYTKGIDDITRKYLSDANTYFVERLIELQTEIDNLKSQIERISNVNFTGLFEELQKVFIDQTKADLAIELNKFDEKSKDLQAKINEIQKQIERLEKIDLEKHFDKLQKTLAEIFGAINAINLTLTTITQTLTGIVQSLGNIQSTIDTNHKEEKQILANFEERIDRHLTGQDNQSAKDVELLESKMKTLAEQNELLEKEVKTNRTIQIVGITIILIILIYIAATKH